MSEEAVEHLRVECVVVFLDDLSAVPDQIRIARLEHRSPFVSLHAVVEEQRERSNLLRSYEHDFGLAASASSHIPASHRGLHSEDWSVLFSWQSVLHGTHSIYHLISNILFKIR